MPNAPVKIVNVIFYVSHTHLSEQLKLSHESIASQAVWPYVNRELTLRYSHVDKADLLKFDGANCAFTQSSKRRHSENRFALF